MDNVLFRCHSFGLIMTNGTGKDSNVMGKTAKNYLKKMHRELTYNRRSKISTKQMEKGIMLENEAIGAVSKVIGDILHKNDVRLKNDFFEGEVDAFQGDSIYKVITGYDTKCSWSLDSFPFPDDDVDPKYDYQAHGYMDLTGADKWVVAHVLLNSPAKFILDEKYKAMKRHDIIDFETPEFIAECQEIERNMIFDLDLFIEENPGFNLHTNVLDWDCNIPLEERIVMFTINRNDDKIKAMHERALEAREYLKSINKK